MSEGADLNIDRIRSVRILQRVVHRTDIQRQLEEVGMGEWLELLYR